MRRATRGRRRPDAGLSLVELMIALVVIAVAILALFSLVVSSSQVQRETREKTLAYNAARRTIEAMRGTAFSEIYARYNSNPGDNPPGASPANTFTVEGLNASGSTPVGQILFAEANGGLSELGDSSKGIPAKNLNRDDDATDTGLTTYDILPLRVQVTWAGVGGKSTTITVNTFISDK